MGSGASVEKAEWKHLYSAMCMASLKDSVKALPKIMELAKDHTAADVKVIPAFSFLGEATNFPDDAAKAYMEHKLTWFILYDNKEAVMTKAESIGKWTMDFKDHLEHDDPEKDLDICYSGAVDCLMAPGLASSQGNFYMMGSFKCKDKEATKTAMDLIKKHAEETMEKEKDGFIGTMIIPPAAVESDMETVIGCEKDDLDTLHVTYLMAFKTEAAWHDHEKKEYWGPFLMSLVTQSMELDEKGEPNMADITIQLHFGNATTFTAGSDLPEAKEGEAKEEPKKVEMGEAPKALAKALKKTDKYVIKEVITMKTPPEAVQNMCKIIYYIMKDGADVKGTSETVKEWDVVKKFMANSSFVQNYTKILAKPSMNARKIAEKIKPLLESIDKDEVTKASKAAAGMLEGVMKLGEWIVSHDERVTKG